jgi:nitrate/TMAO reductase-like tetraheme cytochrome c subunit
VISLIPRLWANWITLLGTVVATVAGTALALFLALDLIAPGKNAYTGGFVILVLPFLFVIGLTLIAIGLWVERRRARRAGERPVDAAFVRAFEAAWRDGGARRRILFVAAVTVLNVVLLGYAGQSSIEYMDSPKFCGTSCHTVMQPEWNAYQRSPHARVACVECHVGAGTASYVKAKANGVHQLWALATDTYHRPVPTPVTRLRGSEDTCEKCHSQRYIGNKFKLYPHYKPDNTPAFNALLLHVGGANPRDGRYEGIHAHTNPELRIEYEYLDLKRAKIGNIRVYERGALKAEYRPPGAPQPALGARTMDCTDCHNRATHVFDASPAAAVDRALASGRLSAKLPGVAGIAAGLLARADVPRADAEPFFRRALATVAAAAPAPLLDETARALAELYRLNVYPEMKLGWGTYRSNLTHAEGQGCFRCHDKEHARKLPDGTEQVLSQDCDGCHERVAIGEDPKTLDDTMQLLLPKEN